MGKQAEQTCAALEAVLGQMVAIHQELLTLLERKRGAMRKGDGRAMTELCALENAKVQAIAELEKKRLELVARLTLLVDPQAPEPMRMAEVAERLPEPVRGRLLTLRQQLRSQLETVKHQTAVARRAAESLVRHVQGLVQSMMAVANYGTTYRKPGAPGRSSAVSTFSMTA
jgi:hypothetical protein